MYMYIYLRFHSYSEKGRTLVPMSQVMFHLFLFPIKIFNIFNNVYLYRASNVVHVKINAI